MATDEWKRVKGLLLEHSAWPLRHPGPQRSCWGPQFTEEDTETERRRLGKATHW